MTPSRRFALGLVWTAAAATTLAATAFGQSDDVADTVRRSRQALEQSLIAAPEDTANASLQEAMERLRAIRLEPKRTGVDALLEADAAQTAPAEQDAGTPSAPRAPQKETPVISPVVLNQLMKIPPKRIADPVALADTLYRTGHTKEAFIFYERSLTEASSDALKAWALFQMANCQRRTDPAAALTLYRRLAADHPDTIWSHLAQSRLRLLAWYQTSAAKALMPAAGQPVSDQAASSGGESPKTAVAGQPTEPAKTTTEKREVLRANG